MRQWPAIHVILFLLFAAAVTAVHYAAYPTLPQKLAHVVFIFLLAVCAWIHLSLGMIRHSGALFAAGAFFLYLTLLGVVGTGQWVQWPGMTLMGAAVALWGCVAVWKLLPYRGIRAEVAVCVCAVAVTPLALRSFNAWSGVPDGVAAAVGAAGLLVAGIFVARMRQRVTIAALATWLYFIAISAMMLVAAFSPALDGQSVHVIESAGTLSLLILAALYMADTVYIERQLRRGPHLQLDVSLKDPLTGVANRRALELHGPQLLHQSHEASRPVSMIIADIDHFKRINDTYGHLVGDAVLRTVSRRLSDCVRKSDLVTRYGGEEFVIILPGSPLVPALRLAERMRHALESEPITVDGSELHITSSFGVVTSFPEEPMSLTGMIARADGNLYRAKHNGRNCVMTDALPAELI